jgi:aryl-alcohol dehydrogenase-like predicted oxidoreductase
MSPDADRRQFLKSAIAGATALELPAESEAADDGRSRGIPTRPLGKTGEQIPIIGLGGHNIGTVKDEQEAIRIMHTAIDEGLTFFDNAWEYHQGRSEELQGKALATDGRRQKVFLMTMFCGRSGDESR